MLAVRIIVFSKSEKSRTLTKISLASSLIATMPLVTVQPSIFRRCLSFIAAILADVSFINVCLVSITDPPCMFTRGLSASLSRGVRAGIGLGQYGAPLGDLTLGMNDIDAGRAPVE